VEGVEIMHTWILVIVMASWSGGATSVAIEITGDEVHCIAAGKKVLADIGLSDAKARGNFSCIRKHKPGSQ
jgi:hypothetical protein